MDLDDEVYFMDLSFINAKPLQTGFLDTRTDVEGEQVPQKEDQVPQRKPSDIESDEDKLH